MSFDEREARAFIVGYCMSLVTFDLMLKRPDIIVLSSREELDTLIIDRTSYTLTSLKASPLTREEYTKWYNYAGQIMKMLRTE